MHTHTYTRVNICKAARARTSIPQQCKQAQYKYAATKKMWADAHIKTTRANIYACMCLYKHFNICIEAYCAI